MGIGSSEFAPALSCSPLFMFAGRAVKFRVCAVCSVVSVFVVCCLFGCHCCALPVQFSVLCAVCSVVSVVRCLFGCQCCVLSVRLSVCSVLSARLSMCCVLPVRLSECCAVSVINDICVMCSLS